MNDLRAAAAPAHRFAPDAAARDLRPLFAPTSVAVVGASDDRLKWGNWLARGALRGEHRRAVHLVNRRGGEVLGRPAHRALADLPGAPELVVLAVPAAALVASLDEAIAAGARAIVAISAGTSDGDAGGALDRALGDRARAAGVALLGPNCLGVFDAAAELELVPNALPVGSIAMVSQSGNLALEIGLRAADVGLGFSCFASVGNQADLDAGDLVRALATDPATRAIALYVEDFRDGRAFTAAAAQAVAGGKPVVLLSVAEGGAGARAVRSHTGALASDEAAIEAACRAAGIERVRTPHEVVDVLQGLLRASTPPGRRVAVLADGGGHGGVAAALAQRAGLEVPPLSPAVVARLREGLPLAAACANPIDLAGGGEQDVHSFTRAVRVLLACGEVDAVLMTGYFGGYGEYAAALGREEVVVAETLGRAAEAARRPLVVHTMYAGGSVAGVLRDGGVPVYGDVERAVAVMARLARRGAVEADGGEGPAENGAAGPTSAATAAGVPALPAPAAPVAGDGYATARALLAAGGVPFAAGRVVTGSAEALAAAAEIGYPVVLKALGALHKSDAGGVVLGLADDAALAQAVAGLQARLRPEAFSVERMAPVHDGVELLVGTRWDARFGPVVLVGLGGVYTEVLRDVAVALAPLDGVAAERLLRTLRAAPLLVGARGRPPVALGAAAEAVAALSCVAAAHPEIRELEVNPLLATADGVLGLDARMVLQDAGSRPDGMVAVGHAPVTTGRPGENR